MRPYDFGVVRGGSLPPSTLRLFLVQMQRVPFVVVVVMRSFAHVLVFVSQPYRVRDSWMDDIIIVIVLVIVAVFFRLFLVIKTGSYFHF